MKKFIISLLILTFAFQACYRLDMSIPVTDVSLSPTSVTLTPTGTQQLSAIVSPDDATNKEVTWSSSAAEVATVSSAGLVTAVNEGTATITVKTVEGGKTAKCTITVINPIEPVISITGVPPTATVGTPLTLTGTVNPTNATNKEIMWSVHSAGTTGATINGSTFNATAAGTATVRATITNGVSKNTNYAQDFNIVVNDKFVSVTNITGVPTTATAGTPLTLTGTITPANATNQMIAWSVQSAGTTGATINGNTFNATAAGTATVRATITNGVSENTNYTQDFNITVDDKFIAVTGITDVPATAAVGTPLTLTGTVNPANATNKQITWSVQSTGTTGATINGSTFNATAVGTATVRATIVNGTSKTTNYTQDFNITVITTSVPVTSITDVPATATVGTPLTLTGTVNPANATNRAITWSIQSAGTTGATINGNTFNATAAGTATVRATIINGVSPTTNYTQNFTITVNLPSSDLTISVTTPGTLCSSVGASKNSVVKLKVIGNLNSADILCIREMAGSDISGNATSGKLQTLDLAGASIVSGGGYYYSYNSTSNNTIGSYMFYNCSKLESITLPTSVTSIGSYAFQYSGLKGLTIPNTVRSIGGNFLANCTNIVSLSLENGQSMLTFESSTAIQSPIRTLHLGREITYPLFGNSPFRDNTYLTTLTISDNVKSLGNSLFEGCSGLTTAITIPNSVTLIGDNTFSGCVSLSAVTIGVDVGKIGSYAFNQCRALSSVTIPSKVTTIGRSAFADCDKLSTVTIENGESGLNFDGLSIFTQCPIKTLHLGRNITYPLFGNSPFRDNTYLTTLTFSSNVTSIGSCLLSGCSALATITSQNPTPPTIASSDCFNGVNKVTCKVYVPSGRGSAYKNANIWGEFGNNIIEQ